MVLVDQHNRSATISRPSSLARPVLLAFCPNRRASLAISSARRGQKFMTRSKSRRKFPTAHRSRSIGRSQKALQACSQKQTVGTTGHTSSCRNLKKSEVQEAKSKSSMIPTNPYHSDFQAQGWPMECVSTWSLTRWKNHTLCSAHRNRHAPSAPPPQLAPVMTISDRKTADISSITGLFGHKRPDRLC